MKIATWNVNSINSRMHLFPQWLEESGVDIVCLQELKCIDEKFPHLEIESLGYNIATNGQKTYNGVAILSKYPIEEVIKNLPTFEDDAEPKQSRYIECEISVNGKFFRVASVYVPNGNQVGSEKFEYKMRFFDALAEHMNNINDIEENIIIGGDFNVAPTDIDVYDPKSLRGQICFHPQEQEKFFALENTNYQDIYRRLHPANSASDNAQKFTWWDYRGNSWGFNKGMRIDFLMANPTAADITHKCFVDLDVRGKEKTSDHAPVIAEFLI